LWGENLKYFLEKAGKNAAYTSKDAVIEFFETIEPSEKASSFSLLADECTDISAIVTGFQKTDPNCTL